MQRYLFNKNKKKIYHLLCFCKENIEFYNFLDIDNYEHFNLNTFSKIHPLDKKVLREDSTILLKNKKLKDNLSRDATSGTEGKQIICYRSKTERINCSKTIWNLRREFVTDLNPKDRFVRFYAYRNKNSKIISDKIIFKKNEILLPLYNLSDKKLIDYWKAILKFKPRWMHGPSTTIYYLCYIIEKYNLNKYDIEFVELSGEYVQEKHSRYIKKVLNCKIANHYGMREYWPIAYTNPKNNKLKIVENNVFLETVFNKETNQEEILLTTFKNNEWPLIRYKTGDAGNIEVDGNNAYLNVKIGRCAEFLEFKNGERYNSIVFSGISRAICDYMNENVILQYQITQTSENILKVDLMLKDNLNKKEILDLYYNEIRKILGKQITVKVECVDFIQPNNFTGKVNNLIKLNK